MNVLIMGSGRLGARVAATLDEAGHVVTVMDLDPSSFRRLPPSFKGTQAVGNGMDGPALQRAGIKEADAFMALTQGDNRNYFASQLAHEIYGVKRVLCRIYDPVRAEIFSGLGLEIFSPTALGASVIVSMLLGDQAAKG